ncbi:hypothetical protein OIU85_010736 [Salix viminalis]|uniref:Secreted protein n=1 Tax=Salix viminalis TaxID=40686 RepID=A0A9Q0NR92_SALVM|nr:hypothetical protein OIU85_010736 [Salix viminalis]
MAELLIFKKLLLSSVAFTVSSDCLLPIFNSTAMGLRASAWVQRCERRGYGVVFYGVTICDELVDCAVDAAEGEGAMDGGVATGVAAEVRTNGGCSGWVAEDAADKDLLCRGRRCWSCCR